MGGSGGRGGLGGSKLVMARSRLTVEPSHLILHVLVPSGSWRSVEYSSALNIQLPSLSRSSDLLASGEVVSRIHIEGSDPAPSQSRSWYTHPPFAVGASKVGQRRAQAANLNGRSVVRRRHRWKRWTWQTRATVRAVGAVWTRVIQRAQSSIVTEPVRRVGTQIIAQRRLLQLA
eukprot:7386779-Prymnesium_polylepis.1